MPTAPPAPFRSRTDASPARGLMDWALAHGSMLRRYLARRAPSADLDDLMQDVFLLLQSRRASGPVVDPERYVVTVARHALISRHRRETARRFGPGDAAGQAMDLITDLSPERILAARQDCRRALTAVAGLPPRARAAFQYRRLDNLTYAVIAARMGISRESAKDLVRRAALRVSDAVSRGDRNVQPLATH